MNDRDLWVVVFNQEEEVFLLSEQIKSLIRLGNKMDYYIVINHHDRKSIKKINELFYKYQIRELLNNAPFKSRIYFEDEIIPEKYSVAETNSYQNQQLIKLQVYKRSVCKESIILDAKNIFASLDPLTNFKHRLPSEPMFSDCWTPCYEACMNRWFEEQKPKYVIPILTPYLFKNNVLQRLEEDFSSTDEYFEFLTQQFVSTRLWRWYPYLHKNWRFKPYILSEFIIYNLFEQTLPYYKGWWKRTPKNKAYTKIVKTKQHLDETFFKKKFPILTIHRRAVKEIGINSTKSYIDMYMNWSE